MFQDPATSIMEGIIDLHNDIMFYLVLISTFVLWMMVRIVMLFAVRENDAADATREVDPITHHTLLEVVWTVTPALILVTIAIPSFALLYAMDETGFPQVTVKAIGHQWYWSYDYHNRIDGVTLPPVAFDSYMVLEDDLPEGGLRLLEVDNRLYLPVNTPIRMLITSADVLHSWAVPSFGVKLDACPGRLNQVMMTINREGSFYGQCSELCGVNHSFMPINVKVLNTDAYVAQLSAMKG
jgi:cytochrome c oxidase subunit 2